MQQPAMLNKKLLMIFINEFFTSREKKTKKKQAAPNVQNKGQQA